MDEMNVRPVYPKPNLSRPRKGAKKHPYLLKNKKILFPNRVWATDITYAPIGKAHMYLVAAIDWYSRYIVGWRLLDDMAAPGSWRACATPSRRTARPPWRTRTRDRRAAPQLTSSF